MTALLTVACTTTGDDNKGTPGLSNGITTLTTPSATSHAYSYHPNIRISPQRGRAGTEITVVGGGFPPNSEVQIRLTSQETGAPNEYMTKTVARQHGNIQASFVMPDKWPSGETISLPQVTILASTPDFADKATALYTYETNVTPETTPRQSPTPTKP